MAIDSKIDFLREAETALAESVTASDMTRIMKVLSDVLEYKDQPKHHVVNYLVREYQPRRPDNCPMKEET